MVNLLLIIGVIAAPASNILIKSKDPAVAPQIAPLPDDMPDPRQAPDQGTWKDNDGKMRFSGTFFPYPLDEQVTLRDAVLEGMPAYIQVQLDELTGVLQKKHAGVMAMTEAANIAEQIKAGPQIKEGFSTMQFIFGCLLSAAAAAGIVMLVHKVQQ